jgi:hypothetical protein
MPEGFEKQLDRKQLTDLLEFLTRREKYLPLVLDTLEPVLCEVVRLLLSSDIGMTTADLATRTGMTPQRVEAGAPRHRHCFRPGSEQAADSAWPEQLRTVPVTRNDLPKKTHSQSCRA